MSSFKLEGSFYVTQKMKNINNPKKIIDLLIKK